MDITNKKRTAAAVDYEVPPAKREALAEDEEAVVAAETEVSSSDAAAAVDAQSDAQTPNTIIAYLPQECVEDIFLRLDAASRTALACTCKTWADICHELNRCARASMRIDVHLRNNSLSTHAALNRHAWTSVLSAASASDLWFSAPLSHPQLADLKCFTETHLRRIFPNLCRFSIAISFRSEQMGVEIIDDRERIVIPDNLTLALSVEFTIEQRISAFRRAVPSNDTELSALFDARSITSLCALKSTTHGTYELMKLAFGGDATNLRELYLCDVSWCSDIYHALRLPGEGLKPIRCAPCGLSLHLRLSVYSSNRYYIPLLKHLLSATSALHLTLCNEWMSHHVGGDFRTVCGTFTHVLAIAINELTSDEYKEYCAPPIYVWFDASVDLLRNSDILQLSDTIPVFLVLETGARSKYQALLDYYETTEQPRMLRFAMCTGLRELEQVKAIPPGYCETLERALQYLDTGDALLAPQNDASAVAP
jgi:hypothetical protein